MIEFRYDRADDVGSALGLIGESGKYLAGGTNLVDLMRETIERPASLVDVTGLPAAIEDTIQGGVRIGAALPCAQQLKR